MRWFFECLLLNRPSLHYRVFNHRPCLPRRTRDTILEVPIRWRRMTRGDHSPRSDSEARQRQTHRGHRRPTSIMEVRTPAMAADSAVEVAAVLLAAVLLEAADSAAAVLLLDLVVLVEAKAATAVD